MKKTVLVLTLISLLGLGIVFLVASCGREVKVGSADELLKVLFEMENSSQRQKIISKNKSLVTVEFVKNLQEGILERVFTGKMEEAEKLNQISYEMAQVFDPNTRKDFLAQASFHKGYILYIKGNWSESLTNYKEALELSGKEPQDKEGIVNVKAFSVRLYIELAEFNMALKVGKEALEIAQAIDYKQGIVEAYNGLGDAKIVLHQVVEAKKEYEQALKMAQEIKYSRGEIVALYGLGLALQELRKPTEAQKNLEEALEIVNRLDYKVEKCTVLLHLSRNWLILGNIKKAIEINDEALALAENIGYVEAQAYLNKQLAENYTWQGRLNRALEYLGRSEQIIEKIKLPIVSWLNKDVLSEIHIKQKEHQEAEKSAKEALKLAQERLSLSFRSITSAYSLLGRIYLYQEDYKAALESYEKALDILQNMRDNLGVADLYRDLGGLWAMQRKVETSLEYYNKARKIYQENGSELEPAIVHIFMGFAHFLVDDFPEAMEHYEAAIKLAEERNNGFWKAGALYSMGMLFARKGVKSAEEAALATCLPVFVKQLAECRENVYKKKLQEFVELEAILKREEQAREIYNELGWLGDILEGYDFLAEFLKILGREQEAANYQRLAEELRKELENP